MNHHYIQGAKKGWATRRQRDACWEAKHGKRKRPAGWKCPGEDPTGMSGGRCEPCSARREELYAKLFPVKVVVGRPYTSPVMLTVSDAPRRR